MSCFLNVTTTVRTFAHAVQIRDSEPDQDAV
jgi:hypothetical protein